MELAAAAEIKLSPRFGTGNGRVHGEKEISFSIDTFLSTVNGGTTIASYRKNQKIFAQGEPPNSVFRSEMAR
jgi:hypothetical protein